MRAHDVDSDEMGRFSNMDEMDIERLLSGEAPSGDADLAEVAAFCKELGEAYPGVSTDASEATHVAAMMDTVRRLAENGGPAERPASDVQEPVRQAAGLPTGRIDMLKDVWANKWARLAAAAVAAAVLAFGGTAYAGVLPAPVQDAVSNAAEQVGIELPLSDVTDADDDGVADVEEADDMDDEAAEVDEADVDEADDEAAEVDDAVDQDDQGEDDDAVEEAVEADDDEADDDGPSVSGSGASHETDIHESDTHESDTHESDTHESDSDEADGSESGGSDD